VEGQRAGRSKIITHIRTASPWLTAAEVLSVWPKLPEITPEFWANAGAESTEIATAIANIFFMV
jgi:hypothetical protein